LNIEGLNISFKYVMLDVLVTTVMNHVMAV